MAELSNVLDSFSLKDELNPKVWENPSNPKKAKLKPKVKEALMKIAEDFIDNLGDDIFVDDITLTGSLSNYNWSNYSDFDLHIIIDFQQYESKAELYKELYRLKAELYNQKHDFKIYGYDVELYAQDLEESHFATGVYSLMNEEWVVEPEKSKKSIDKNLLKNKLESWVKKIDSAIEKSEKENDETSLKKIKDKIKEYRQCGLEKDGELSYENLVFKGLRRLGSIGKILDTKKKITDKKLSVEKKLEESIKKILEQNYVEGEYDVTESDSKFLNYLDELKDNGAKFEYTPGLKIPYISDVEKIQTGLQFLGFSLPKWGVDGKYGPETESATMNFQENSGLMKNGVFGPMELEVMISKMIEKDFKDSDLESIQKVREVPYDIFTYLDLNDPEELKIYKDICDKFIEYRNPNAEVTGEMMANCARNYFSQGYVPPELALAQLTAEGGLSKNPESKPIRTKNPFNVGNTDSGKVNVRDSFEDGVCLYYDLMTRRYLVGDRKAEDLLQNFVNVNGNRYASAQEYETSLTSLVNTIKKVTQP